MKLYVCIKSGLAKVYFIRCNYKRFINSFHNIAHVNKLVLTFAKQREAYKKKFQGN